MNKDVFRQALVALAVVATIAMNILANALPLNGVNTGEISDRFQVYFVPAGYVFSIWGLIYLALIAYGVYQALPGQRENPRLRQIGYPFVASCVANIVWLFLWHYGYFGGTVIAMLALLSLLIFIYLRLGIGKVVVPTAEKWAVHVPFSIYLGWISVATIANISDYLFLIGWGGWGLNPQVWAAIMLATAGALSALMGLRRDDVAYLLVIIWAVIGIAVKQAGATLVVNTAWVVAVFVAMMLGLTLLATRRRAAG